MNRLMKSAACFLAAFSLVAVPVQAQGRGRQNHSSSQQSAPSRGPGSSNANRPALSKDNNRRQTRPNVHATRPEATPGSAASARPNRPGIGNSNNSGHNNNRPSNPGAVNNNNNNNHNNRPGNSNGWSNGNNNHNNRPGAGNKPGNNNRPGGNNFGHNNPGPGHNNPGHGHNPGQGFRPGNGHNPGHAPGYRPMPPRVPHGYRPPIPVFRGWHRPVPPPRFHGYMGPGPSFNTILGVALGTALDFSIRSLLNAGYNVVNYGNDVVYLTGVNQMNLYWPNAALYYNNGLLCGSQFTYPTGYYDTSRYNLLYNNLTTLYGMPIEQTNAGGVISSTWFGPANRFVTLQYNSIGGQFYTTLSFGN